MYSNFYFAPFCVNHVLLVVSLHDIAGLSAFSSNINSIETRALIFKGTTLEDEVIVGAACVITGICAPKGSRVIGNPGKVLACAIQS